MFPMLRQILRTGLVSEPHPAADESLRVTSERLSAAISKPFNLSYAGQDL